MRAGNATSLPVERQLDGAVFAPKRRRAPSPAARPRCRRRAPRARVAATSWPSRIGRRVRDELLALRGARPRRPSAGRGERRRARPRRRLRSIAGSPSSSPHSSNAACNASSQVHDVDADREVERVGVRGQRLVQPAARAGRACRPAAGRGRARARRARPARPSTSGCAAGARARARRRASASRRRPAGTKTSCVSWWTGRPCARAWRVVRVRLSRMPELALERAAEGAERRAGAGGVPGARSSRRAPIRASTRSTSAVPVNARGTPGDVRRCSRRRRAARPP